MVDKFIEYDKCNSLIVIDSLNGLLDYFNFYGINEIANNDKNMKGPKRDRQVESYSLQNTQDIRA